MYKGGMKTRPVRLAALLGAFGFASALGVPAGAARAQQGTGSSYAQQQQQPRDGDTATDPGALQRQVGKILLEEKVPGAAIVLATTEGPALLAAFGMADPLAQRPVDPGTPFSAGALSPLLVALTAARVSAADFEAAALDPLRRAPAPSQPAAEVLSRLEQPLRALDLGLSNRFEASAPLRLEQLLEQTAGLEDLAPREELPAAVGNPALDEVMHLRPHPLRWPPGRRFSPSRSSFTAAALQLEKWGHGSFAALFEAEVARPLGLTCTSFRSEAFEGTLAVGQRDERPYDSQAQLHWPALGLFTCAQDLSALLLALLGTFQGGELHGRPLLPPALLARLHAGTTLPLPAGVTLSGLGTRAEILDGHLGAGLGGTSEGSAASLVWFAAEKRGYAVLLASENAGALARVTGAVRRFLLREVPPVQVAPALAAAEAAAAAARVEGVWAPVAPPSELRSFLGTLLGFAIVRQSGGELTCSLSLAPPRALVATGQLSFRYATEPLSSLALVQGKQGEAGPEGDELVTPAGTFARASGTWVLLRLLLVGGALLLLLASLAFALVWVPRAALGALPGETNLRLRAFPALAALVFFEWLLLWERSHQPLGARNLTTVLLAALGVLYAALALAGLLEALRRPAAKARSVRSFCLATSLLAVFLAGLLASHGLIGVRTWVW